MTVQKTACGSYVDTDDPGEPGYGTQRLSVTDEEGKKLSVLVAGKTVFEIGTGLGVSTKWLASKAKSVTSYDVDPWVRGHVWPQLTALKNLQLTDQLGWDPPQFDVVFIDGHHETNAVLADIELAKKLKPKKILIHDAYAPHIQKAVQLSGLTMTIEDTAHGLGVIEL